VRRVDEEVLVGGPAQEPVAAEYRSLRVVIPGRPPARVAQLQAVVEGVAGAEQPLAPAFQHESRVARGVARGVDGSDVGEDLVAVPERARKTVSARVRDALSKIGQAHPELADHLRSSLRMGTLCSYSPAEPVTWKLS